MEWKIIIRYECIPLVNTSFEISTFMPEDANSIAGNTIEDEEFSSADQAYVLLEDKENGRVKVLKTRIQSIEGV